MRNQFVCLILGISAAAPVMAQQLPSVTVPVKGDTVNMTVQNGSRSSLSFGSTTSFGASASLNATDGTSTAATSTLAPASGGELTFSLGSGTPGGSTSANIDNLRAQGSGSTTVGGATVDSKDSSFSSGNAKLTGVQSSLNLTLDQERTGFTARTNTLQATYGATEGQDGAQLKTGSQIANTTSNASITSTTNVDINSTSFTSVFMQAF